MTVGALQPAEGYWATKPVLLRLLAEIEASGWCRYTLYKAPASPGLDHLQGRLPGAAAWEEAAAQVLGQLGHSETGWTLFLGDEQAMAVAAPFPLLEDASAEGAQTAPLVRLLGWQLLIGVVLLRLGRYAVGVLRGDILIASKTGSRYVKSRHRAGGSSQRRFERGRQRLIRELFDKTCETVRRVVSPYQDGMDHVFMGGERHTLRAFLQRCGYLRGLERITLGRVLQVRRPGQAALDGIASEVWKSRVQTFSVGE